VSDSRRSSSGGSPQRTKRPSWGFLGAAASVLLILVTPALADSGILPDPTLTPGAVRTTNIGEVCSASTRDLRHWSRERDDHVMAEYGLPEGAHPQFEVDHLIPLCLGGADSDANLWPEPRRSIEPTWNAERKDELEALLCHRACTGELDIGEAQQMIADDWTTAYSRFFPSTNSFLSPAEAMTPK
jgi:hypothetical protein